MSQLHDDHLRALYRELLRPAFPDEELVTEEAFVAGCHRRDYLLHELADDGQTVALAVGEHHPASQVLLVSWLAVRPGVRGGGFGGRVLDGALAAWEELLQPVLVLGEVEHPSTALQSMDFGDPAARVRFYHRRGVRALPVPYAQPPLREGGRSVDGLMLVVLRHDGHVPGTSIPAEPVRRFLADWLEGQPIAHRALAAIEPGRMATLALDLPSAQLPNPLRPRGMRP